MAATTTKDTLADSRFLNYLNGPQRPVLVFDGATGTSLQEMELTAEDFGGLELEGCNENLVVTRPDAVQAVHRQFLDVGCDVGFRVGCGVGFGMGCRVGGRQGTGQQGCPPQMQPLHRGR